ncbi:MAG: hypothetical protein WBD58_17690, partial [Geitlerinemataceae cyanobacterium]
MSSAIWLNRSKNKLSIISQSFKTGNCKHHLPIVICLTCQSAIVLKSWMIAKLGTTKRLLTQKIDR